MQDERKRSTSLLFQFYSGGVYDSAYCSSFRINHAMLVVGYGTATTSSGYTKDYWILKNRHVGAVFQVHMILLEPFQFQLGQEVGPGGVRVDVKEQVQPVWHSN